MPSREENISSLSAAVQHNFRRALLLPSRKDNISNQGGAVQHNFRHTLLVPFREKNIIEYQLRGRRGTARPNTASRAKIPKGAKSFTMKSTRQGSNDGELLYPNYTGCKAKRQRLQWHPQIVQLHSLHPLGYGTVFLTGRRYA